MRSLRFGEGYEISRRISLRVLAMRLRGLTLESPTAKVVIIYPGCQWPLYPVRFKVSLRCMHRPWLVSY